MILKPFMCTRPISSGKSLAIGGKMIHKARMKETYMTSITIGTEVVANKILLSLMSKILLITFLNI